MNARTYVASLIAGAGLLGLGFTVATPAPAEANGTFIRVVMSYTQGVSNYGSTTATGTAEVLMKEGEVKLKATGLTPLTTQTYQFWLVNMRTGEAFSGGRISPDERGNVNVTNVLPAEIPDKGYTMAFLSVEGPDIVAKTPSNIRSIAGPMAPSAETVATERPPVLPNTGGDLDRTTYVPVTYQEVQPAAASSLWAPVFMAAGGAGVVMGLMGFALGRKAGNRGGGR